MISTIKAKIKDLANKVKSKFVRVEYRYLVSEEVVQDLKSKTPVVLYKPGDRAPSIQELAFYHGQLKAIDNLERAMKRKGE